MNNLFTIYILNRKQNNSVWLASIVAIVLLLFRVKLTHSMYLLFLIWNLFLAIIPYYLSSNIYENFFKPKKKIQNTIFAFTWLLFIPNTFYIITDFTHLHYKGILQFGLDFIIISSFSLAGFYIGLLSLKHIHKLTIAKYGNKIGSYFIVLISFLSAFGIYLGRILRFNSWDILTKPLKLISASTSTLFTIETILYSIQLGTIILISYLIFFNINFNNKNQKQ